MNITPFIIEQFSGVIWHLEIDESNDLVLLEIRKAEDKSVSFSSIDLSTGKINFKDLAAPGQWLTGIEAAYRGVLLLHHYESEGGPAHKGLMAISSVTGEILWTNYTFTFDHLSHEGLVVFDARIQPRKLLHININTGILAALSNLPHSILANNIIWPGVMTTGDMLSDFPFAVLAVPDTLYYLDYNNYKIVSLHALREGRLSQLLYIAAGNVIVYEDLLNTDIQKIQPEAFILHKNRLIYVKDKSKLIVLTF